MQNGEVNTLVTAVVKIVFGEPDDLKSQKHRTW